MKLDIDKLKRFKASDEFLSIRKELIQLTNKQGELIIKLSELCPLVDNYYWSINYMGEPVIGSEISATDI